MAIRVLQTLYAGKKFRSRLEAKWAVFFDALSIEWEYEPDGFQLEDGTRYLPDFYLPKLGGGVYVEVKPPGDQFYKARKFAIEAPRPIWLCGGEPRWTTSRLVYSRVGANEDGTVSRELIDDEVVPLMCKALEDHRFWFYPGELEPEEIARESDPHIFAALDAVRLHRFWEPGKAA